MEASRQRILAQTSSTYTVTDLNSPKFKVAACFPLVQVNVTENHRDPVMFPFKQQRIVGSSEVRFASFPYLWLRLQMQHAAVFARW